MLPSLATNIFTAEYVKEVTRSVRATRSIEDVSRTIFRSVSYYESTQELHLRY
jgi:hypothetical protein